MFVWVGGCVWSTEIRDNISVRAPLSIAVALNIYVCCTAIYRKCCTSRYFLHPRYLCDNAKHNMCICDDLLRVCVLYGLSDGIRLTQTVFQNKMCSVCLCACLMRCDVNGGLHTKHRLSLFHRTWKTLCVLILMSTFATSNYTQPRKLKSIVRHVHEHTHTTHTLAESSTHTRGCIVPYIRIYLYEHGQHRY